MRPVNKALYQENRSTYNPYGDAKKDLIGALGEYCSYCERRGFDSALDVEHINDKATHPLQKCQWDNFLLACKNCNSIKGTQPVDNCLLPHRDNTFIAFSYLESGFVQVNTQHSGEEALNLMNLVGLDRTPAHPNHSPKDTRWQERKRAWELGVRYRQKYDNAECDGQTVVDLALGYGFWSLWMGLFGEYPEIKEGLTRKFAGTRREHFE